MLEINQSQSSINPWEGQIRAKVQTLYRIIAWKVASEGAIAAVIANNYCIDPAAFIMNGPTEEYLAGHKTEDL